MADILDMAQAISRHSESGQQEKDHVQQKPKQVSFSDIPAQAWKKDSVYNDAVANKFDPARDTIAEAVSGSARSPKGKRANSTGKAAPGSSPAAFKSAKDANPEEKERLRLIKQVNLYVSNQLIVNRLAKKGVQFPCLPSNASKEQAEEIMEGINEALSGDVSKSLVIQTITGLNVVTESAVPILKKQHPGDLGLSEGFLICISKPETDLALSMEELSIMIRPYLPVAGAFSRFAYNYGKLCTEIAMMKQQKMKQATAGEDQEYYEDETPVDNEDSIPV